MTTVFSHIFKPYVTTCGRRHHAGHLQDKRDHPSTATKGTCKSILPTPTREKFPSPQSTGLIIPCPKSALKDLIFANSRNWIYIRASRRRRPSLKWGSLPTVVLWCHEIPLKSFPMTFFKPFLCKEVKNMKKYWNPTIGFLDRRKREKSTAGLDWRPNLAGT